MVNACLIYGIELTRKELHTAICSFASFLPENDKIVKVLNVQSFREFEDSLDDEDFEAYDFIDDVNKELFRSERGLKFNFRLNSACCCTNKDNKPYFFGWSSGGCKARKKLTSFNHCVAYFFRNFTF